MLPVSYAYHVTYYLPDVFWYAHYRHSDGALLSLGTVLPNPVPVDTSLLRLSVQPDLIAVEWDPGTLAFVARDPETLVDRVYDDLATDESLTDAWSALDTTQADAMKSRFAAMLGSHLYRILSEPVDLD